MDEDDYRELILVVERQLQAVGLDDLTDERHYIDLDEDTGDARPVSPRRHLLEMLHAFERALAVRDRRTYAVALGRINERLQNDGPRGAFVVPAGEGPAVDLGSVPDLGQVREELTILIKELSKFDDTGEGRFR